MGETKVLKGDVLNYQLTVPIATIRLIYRVALVEYITQVPEEIEGEVLKRVLHFGALSKLGEVLLNSQIRAFSGTDRGTFRNTDVEHQQPTGKCCQNDHHPNPKVEFSACRNSNLSDSGPDETSHMVTAVQKVILFCSAPGGHFQEHKRRSAPQVIPSFAKKTPLRKLKQTRFCWPPSSWRPTATPPTSTTTLTEFHNCLSPSRQKCPFSTGIQRNLNCLKIYSKGV